MLEAVDNNVVANLSKDLLNNLLKAEDPIKELGPGISSFHSLLILLSLLMFALFLLHLPVLQEFKNSSFYEYNDGWIVSMALGNLGFSRTYCQSASMFFNSELILKCNTGSITKLLDWGIVTSFEDSLTCKMKTSNTCDSQLNNPKMQNQFITNCMGKKSCSIKGFK